MENIKTKVVVLWLAIVLAIFIGANTPMTEAQELEYLNEDHKYFCIIAEDRWASDEYLVSNQCPNEK